MSATNGTPTKPAGPFVELAALEQVKANLTNRLGVVGAELRPIGWRSRPQNLQTREPAVAGTGRINAALSEIRKEQVAAGREGREPDVAVLKAEIQALEPRSDALRSEARALRLEIDKIDKYEKAAVVRRRLPEFVEHTRGVAAQKAEHGAALSAACRELLADRGEISELLSLLYLGRPGGMADHLSVKRANDLSMSFAPWVRSNRPDLKALWAAVEMIASTSWGPAEREAA
jgi:hypothetical protein